MRRSTYRDGVLNRRHGPKDPALDLVNSRHRVKDWHVALAWLVFVLTVLGVTQ